MLKSETEHRNHIPISFETNQLLQKWFAIQEKKCIQITNLINEESFNYLFIATMFLTKMNFKDPRLS